MISLDANKIDLEKLGSELQQYEQQWIAISANNTIVAYGKTYGEAVHAAEKKSVGEVILFKVPPLDYSLSPQA
jgi:hypothetical protein